MAHLYGLKTHSALGEVKWLRGYKYPRLTEETLNSVFFEA